MPNEWPDRTTWAESMGCLAAMVDAWHDSRAVGVDVKLVRCPDCKGTDDECERCEGSGEVVDERSKP